jgi:hypothetical protein
MRDSRISSLDETSHRVLQHLEEILAQKDKHQVGDISSCERGENVTGVYAVSVSGFCDLPVLIYPRTRIMEKLSYGAPPGTLFRWQNGFWSVLWTEASFHLSCETDTTGKGASNLDGPSSHTLSLTAIEIPRKQGVIMLRLPLPALIEFSLSMSGFSWHWAHTWHQRLQTKLREKAGRRLSTEHTASLVGMEFPKAATMETATDWFRNSGLWPVDHYVFTNDYFALPIVTDWHDTIQLEKLQTAFEISAWVLHMKLGQEPQNKLQAIADTFCGTFKHRWASKTEVKKETHCIWCDSN